MGTIARYAKAYQLSVEDGIPFELAVERIDRGAQMDAELRHAEALRRIQQAPPPTQETDVDHKNSNSVVRRKKAALVSQLVGIWPSIAGDLREASRPNGLKIAKLEHGFWDMNKAIEWAVERDKITKQKAVQSIATEPDSPWALLLKQSFSL
ncbi:MAG: hypothetical protein PHV02_20115 [Rhodocyclaceae bacterium]|nr:hypothetical protein [Rhodocyclaceae bacterium]